MPDCLLRDSPTRRPGSCAKPECVPTAIALILISFSVWLAHSITRPGSVLTIAMQRLVGGDKTVRIPGTIRKDEIGGMSRAALVFKENMIRNDEVQAAQEEERKAK